MNTQTLDPVLLQTDFPELELFASGKVRDVYQLGSDHLLFVATDRISAFDFVLATGIPNKGRVLTQISLFWFDFLKGIVPNHLITADVNRYPAEVQQYASQLLHTMLTDATVAEVFTRVQQMIAPPTLFFRPDILMRVLAAGMRRRQRVARTLDAGQPETALSSD